MLEGKKIAVMITGGIAAYKVPSFVRGLIKAGAQVRVAMTPQAEKFVTAETLKVLTKYPVLLEAQIYPEEVGHVHLADWADLAVVIPATANTLSKMANGLADNELTSSLLAMTCPKMLVPAMNSNMWSNFATKKNIATLKEAGLFVIEPEDGFLAEGYSGKGRMPDPEVILQALYALSALEDLKGKVSLAGEKVAISAGGTEEAIDPVRFIGNRSSGKMGVALAYVAALAGAEVTLVCAKSAQVLPVLPQIQTREITTARELNDVMTALNAEADVLIMAAAVSDFRVENQSQRKIKKDKSKPKATGLQLNLVENPDILKGLSNETTYLVGFAAETDHVEDYAKEKLQRKGVHMIVANDVSQKNIGFCSENNAVTILTQHSEVKIPLANKFKIAAAILQEIQRDRHQEIKKGCSFL